MERLVEQAMVYLAAATALSRFLQSRHTYHHRLRLLRLLNLPLNWERGRSFQKSMSPNLALLH
jgi:hypothetical protein